MLRRRLLAMASLAAAVAACVLVVLVLLDGADERGGTRTAEIRANASFSPVVALFGDTVTAHVDVVLDKTRVDPDSLRVVADVAPFELVGSQQRMRRDADRSAYVRVSLVLRCLSVTCVPSGQSARYEFEPARLSFTAPGPPEGDTTSIDVGLPSLRMYSRFTAAGAGAPQVETGQPWRADLSSLPSVSYRIAPAALIGLLLAGAIVAALAALALCYVAWPRRVPAPPPEPEPELPPEPLSPLEQALVLLEQSIRVDGGADHRRALELVAEELELADWGDRDLARTAKALAWSKNIPPVADTAQLAARVRSSLPEPVATEETEVHA